MRRRIEALENPYFTLELASVGSIEKHCEFPCRLKDARYLVENRGAGIHDVKDDH